MSHAPKIILLTLGEELLLGLTRNAHLTYIGEQLRMAGAQLHANLTLSDQPSDIAEYFLPCWQSADVVITTGGLGPTSDDRTREVLAEALGEALAFDASILNAIQNRFDALGLTMTPNNRKQALRFANAVVLPNPNGTAPGLWLEKDGKTLVMLPGPPRELQPMFEREVLPRFRERGWLQSAERYLQIRTIGVPESGLETMLLPILERYPDAEVAYCAHQGQVDFRLSYSVEGREDELLRLAAECKRALGDDFLCVGHDTLPKIVSDILRRKGMTLATAESCTGGMIANAITDQPGASSVFLGGIVSYGDQAKADLLGVPEAMIQQHGAVSEEVALAMASGAAEKLEADYAISATGYAGPDGGTDAKPVGIVYIGLSSPRGIWARKLFFKGARSVIKTRALNAALDWLRRELLASDQIDDEDSKLLRAESAKILRSLR